MKTLFAIIAVLAIATPVFAQSFDPEAGTGNVLPSYYGADGGLHAGSAAQYNDQIAERGRIRYGSAAGHSPATTAGPRFSRIGLLILPSSRRRLKFCMFRAPICRMST